MDNNLGKRIHYIQTLDIQLPGILGQLVEILYCRLQRQGKYVSRSKYNNLIICPYIKLGIVFDLIDKIRDWNCRCSFLNLVRIEWHCFRVLMK